MALSPPRKQPRSKEQYLLDSLTSVFKTGHWIEGGEGSPAPEKNYEQPLYVTGSYLTVIGGQRFDEESLCLQLGRMVEDSTPIVTGAGRGVEQYVYEDWAGPGSRDVRIEVNPELYGKNARKINVEQVLSFAPESPLLLVGNGERVKQARAWLKRARWPREVIQLP